MSEKQLDYKQVQFEVLLGQFRNLQVFKPTLPEGWYYLGPVAVDIDQHEPGGQNGLIVRAEDQSALGDIIDWKPVFIDIEGAKFSTWRGIPADPTQYVSGGDILVTGIEKPTPEQTAGIKAVRVDLVAQHEPNHLIIEIRLPKAVATFWNILGISPLHGDTGAFASTGQEKPVGLTIPVICFNAWYVRVGSESVKGPFF